SIVQTVQTTQPNRANLSFDDPKRKRLWRRIGFQQRTRVDVAALNVIARQSLAQLLNFGDACQATAIRGRDSVQLGCRNGRVAAKDNVLDVPSLLAGRARRDRFSFDRRQCKGNRRIGGKIIGPRGLSLVEWVNDIRREHMDGREQRYDKYCCARQPPLRYLTLRQMAWN